MSKWTAADVAAAQQRTAKAPQKPVDSPKRTRATTTAPTQSKPATGKPKRKKGCTREDIAAFRATTMRVRREGLYTVIEWK